MISEFPQRMEDSSIKINFDDKYEILQMFNVIKDEKSLKALEQKLTFKIQGIHKDRSQREFLGSIVLNPSLYLDQENVQIEEKLQKSLFDGSTKIFFQISVFQP